MIPRKLPLGKVPIDVLKRLLELAPLSEDVIVGPGIGIDAAIMRSEDDYIIAACDPITGASKEIGWLSVHVNANDIYASAGKPRWYVATLLFPKDSTEEQIVAIMRGIREGLEETGASLVAGHTELTNRVTEAIVVGTMIGSPFIPGKYISNRSAKVGDAIIMTKGAGIEGTWILLEERGSELELPARILSKIPELKKMVSIRKDVQALLRIGINNIHAMHDATEGGVLGAIYEVSEASRVGFEIYEESIIVREETQILSEILGIDPLKLISSGTLLATVDKDYAEDAIKVLKKEGIDSSVIGYIRESDRILVKKAGERLRISSPPTDELWRIIGSC
ncbi:MAG: AIR synthase family protein [Crenarchaeota archaeon]|nr:AIR synthase family protein [Thermoproteota archaeon]MCR8454060.1 AIR synthase family protein [Thermoproteota archaeon]MCR8456040.1 AIR synthase family protein [Thermoproteota archaeon]MCR8462953.1 AIR synthase family protein [Thermoproteota archaeon]MCR8471132.1 AIR synthase family protein [Thermoproteota archaeon]